MSLQKNRGSRDYYSYFQDNVAYLNVDGAAIPVGRFVGGQYNSAAQTYADGDPVLFQFTSAGRLMTDATLTVEGDIEIGAVELKDATSATRAKIKTDGTDNALVVVQNTLPSGTNTIGDVTVSSLPALVAGTAAIGTVEVTKSVAIDVASVVQTSPTMAHGSNLDVDGSAEQMTAVSFNCKQGVVVKADVSNSGLIYVGNADVTDGTTALTDGIPLSAGEWVEVEIDNPNKIYVISSDTNDKVYWIAV